ncbi:MAG TPA: WD40 repeat domain-containing protein [Blastocatellia bacterium]|nr:WD40 repeat domain-containing protein [Blastocatellia bacterium]HMV84566.1 WD40 repeat domain-containing protein [Blastocatellia bacterium]HMX26824.1 WD40 repeat domain-containing protein [Blastocatellia bacterium]HMZ18159.1 WD40 repeat domain-containing protein [Blastocatellia bacterium]HNG32673.1 WD40 repeat domain-containing protein [Blastocatellia bacterium]
MGSLAFSQKLTLIRFVFFWFSTPLLLTKRVCLLCLCLFICANTFSNSVTAQGNDCYSGIAGRDCTAILPTVEMGQWYCCETKPPTPRPARSRLKNEITTIQNIQTTVMAPSPSPSPNITCLLCVGDWKIGDWGWLITILAVLVLVLVIVCHLPLTRPKAGSLASECDTPQLAELPPEIRLWQEKNIECLSKPPSYSPVGKRRLSYFSGKVVSFINNNLMAAAYRTDVLRTLKEELTVRIDLRKMEIEQKLREHVAVVQQVQIENYRRKLLRERNNPHLNGDLPHWRLMGSNTCGETNYRQLPEPSGCTQEEPRTPTPCPPPRPHPPCPAPINVHPCPPPRPHPPCPTKPEPTPPPCTDKTTVDDKSDEKNETEDCTSRTSARIVSPQTKAPLRHPYHRGMGRYRKPPDKGLKLKFPGQARFTYEFQLQLKGHSDVVNEVAFSPDGETLATAGRDKTIRFWDYRTGKASRYGALSCHSEVNCIAFSPQGDLLVAGHEDSSISIWATQSLSPLIKETAHLGPIRSVAFSPNGSNFASASVDGMVGIWNSDLLRLVRMLYEHSDEVSAIAFSPDGQLLVSASNDQSIRYWKTNVLCAWEKNIVSYMVKEHLGEVSALAFSPHSKILASASWDRTIRLWEKTKDDKLISKPPLLEGHSAQISTIAFSPDGTLLASGGWDHKVILWNAAEPGILWESLDTLSAHTNEVTSVSFSKDGKYLASASDDKTVVIWSRKKLPL